VAALPFDSLTWLVNAVHDGLFGKTSPECLRLTADGRSVPSSGAWQNAGMGSLTEFWTLSTSESPSDAAVCLLSDIIETGDVPPQCSLTGHNIARMKMRLEKYVGANQLLDALNRYSDGLETRRQSLE
jgi:hypothetical protein